MGVSRERVLIGQVPFRRRDIPLANESPWTSAPKILNSGVTDPQKRPTPNETLEPRQPRRAAEIDFAGSKVENERAGAGATRRAARDGRGHERRRERDDGGADGRRRFGANVGARTGIHVPRVAGRAPPRRSERERCHVPIHGRRRARHRHLGVAGYPLHRLSQRQEETREGGAEGHQRRGSAQPRHRAHGSHRLGQDVPPERPLRSRPSRRRPRRRRQRQRQTPRRGFRPTRRLRHAGRAPLRVPLRPRDVRAPRQTPPPPVRARRRQTRHRRAPRRRARPRRGGGLPRGTRGRLPAGSLRRRAQTMQHRRGDGSRSVRAVSRRAHQRAGFVPGAKRPCRCFATSPRTRER